MAVAHTIANGSQTNRIGSPAFGRCAAVTGVGRAPVGFLFAPRATTVDGALRVRGGRTRASDRRGAAVAGVARPCFLAFPATGGCGTAVADAGRARSFASSTSERNTHPDRGADATSAGTSNEGGDRFVERAISRSRRQQQSTRVGACAMRHHCPRQPPLTHRRRAPELFDGVKVFYKERRHSTLGLIRPAAFHCGRVRSHG